MATTKLLPIVLPRTKKQTSKPATTNNKNRAIMKKATTTTTTTTAANSNTSHAAERSVAYKLHIRAEARRPRAARRRPEPRRHPQLEPIILSQTSRGRRKSLERPTAEGPTRDWESNGFVASKRPAHHDNSSSSIICIF
jgi:hypothetical protein